MNTSKLNNFDGAQKSKISDIKEAAKKSWNFIWKDDSWLSWIVSLILAFIIVKFIFFPLLSLALGTSLPLVVVESSSMSHASSGSFLGNIFSTSASFNSWWNQAKPWYEEKNITKQEAESWPMKTGMEKGDIIVVYGRNKPEIGDTIVFNANTQYPIIHRVIDIFEINGQVIYSTKGDNNPGQLEIEKSIPENALIGKAIFKIPKLGWIKLAFVEIINLFKG